MNKRLFVAGLPFSTTQDELRDVFVSIGKLISVNIITDRVTGESKGFGFVEMETEDEAQVAISKLNNTELSGRKLVVAEARPMEATDRPKPGNGRSFSPRRGGGRGGFNRGGRNSGKRNFRVGRY